MKHLIPFLFIACNCFATDIMLKQSGVRHIFGEIVSDTLTNYVPFTEFNLLMNTNGITAAYADAHYLAMDWSNNVLNAQVTSSNALPKTFTNSVVYTDTVAKVSTAVQPNTSTSLSNVTVNTVLFGTNSILRWNGEERKQSLEFTHPDGGVVSINGETYGMFKNVDSVAISNGQPVCLFSGVGRIGTMKLADADDATRTKNLGVYTGNSDLPVNGVGRITTFGSVESFNLQSLSDTTVIEGSELNLSTNAGRYTTNTYSAPIECVSIGVCTYFQANNSDIQVSIHNNKLWNTLDSRYYKSGDGISVSNVSISGNLTFSNTAWDDMTISALTLSSGQAAPEVRVYTNGSLIGVGIKGLNYDSGDSSHGQVQFSHRKKRATDVNPHIHWSTIDNRSAVTNISFHLDALYGSINGLLTNAYSRTITVNGTNAFYHQISSFTPFGSNSLNESGIVLFEITCVEDGGANDKLFIHDIDFHYQIDKVGSDNEIPNGL